MSKQEMVTIKCFGGCGRCVTLRKSKVALAHYYLCHSRQDGANCEKMLPDIPGGMIRRIEINAAAHFWGYTDEQMNGEQAESVQRARAILAAGLARTTILKAKSKTNPF